MVKTKQHSQATTIENLKSGTSWEFHALLIKDTECIGILSVSADKEKGIIGGILTSADMKKSLSVVHWIM